MTTYAQQLADWADSLAAGHSVALLADLAENCTPDDVARYLENAMGERRRLLIEELSFVALAFDDFTQRVDQYLSETPRRTYAVTERDQERFLKWLRRGSLNAQQQDFVTYQSAEYACFSLAQKNRVAHLEFQRLWSEREQVTETKDEQNKTVVVNPVHVWSRLEVAAGGEPGNRPGDVVFVAVENEIRSLWLNEAYRRIVRDLTKQRRTAWTQWQSKFAERNPDELAHWLQQLIDGGLVVVC